nr:PREDICTED: type I iodothyronine deiodinase isoform X1 [Latimeria chalumnae]|eukprot:XP_014347855.1 PREDICTED: type I iodothyronine deiodinase isoform X1 [Latimeria chalumnae]
MELRSPKRFVRPGTSATYAVTCLVLNNIYRKKFLLEQGKKTTMTQNPKFRYEDWGPKHFSFRFLKAISYFTWRNLGDEAFVGQPAPNTPVIDLQGKPHSIFDFVKGKEELIRQVETDVAEFAPFLKWTRCNETSASACLSNRNTVQNLLLKDTNSPLNNNLKTPILFELRYLLLSIGAYNIETPSGSITAFSHLF